jgi:hypothetical protein
MIRCAENGGRSVLIKDDAEGERVFRAIDDQTGTALSLYNWRKRD